MGQLLGHAIRFGVPHDVMIVGEGIETLLSLAQIMPDMPLAAATSSAHLAAFLFPPLLRRLYIAQDNDDAGRLATANLAERANEHNIKVIPLVPKGGDFNDDLLDGGADALAAQIVGQLCEIDRSVIRTASR